MRARAAQGRPWPLRFSWRCGSRAPTSASAVSHPCASATASQRRLSDGDGVAVAARAEELVPALGGSPEPRQPGHGERRHDAHSRQDRQPHRVSISSCSAARRVNTARQAGRTDAPLSGLQRSSSLRRTPWCTTGVVSMVVAPGVRAGPALGGPRLVLRVGAQREQRDVVLVARRGVQTVRTRSGASTARCCCATRVCRHQSSGRSCSSQDWQPNKRRLAGGLGTTAPAARR